MTGTPASAIRAAVEPVETIATPAACSAAGEVLEPGLVVDADQRAADAGAHVVELVHGMVTFRPVTVQPSRAIRPTTSTSMAALVDLDALVQRRLVVVVAHRHGRPGR